VLFYSPSRCLHIQFSTHTHKTKNGIDRSIYLTVRKPKKPDGLHSNTQKRRHGARAHVDERPNARQSETDAPDGRAGARGSLSTRTDRRVSGRGRIALRCIESRFRCVSFRRGDFLAFHFHSSDPRVRCRTRLSRDATGSSIHGFGVGFRPGRARRVGICEGN
jgi:hypothetical protein